MGSRRGSEYLKKVKAAKSWGYLPTSMILGKHKKGVPTKWDLLLAEAEFVVELERCGQCGDPRYVCQSDDPDIDFHIRLEECNATQKRLRAEEARSKKKKGADGVAIGTEAYTHSGAPLDSFRESFYEKKVKQREVEEAELEARRSHAASA